MSALILWFEQRERQLQQSTQGVRKTNPNPNPNPNPSPNRNPNPNPDQVRKTLRDLKQARTAH